VTEGSVGTSVLAEFAVQAASRRRALRRGSFWDALLAAARAQMPFYRGYSYGRRGDLYVAELDGKQGAALEREAQQLGVGDVRLQAAAFARAVRLVYVCPR